MKHYFCYLALVALATAAPKTKGVETCGNAHLLNSKAAQKILDDSGAFSWLDQQLTDPKFRQDWINKVWDKEFHNGNNEVGGCNKLVSDCSVPDAANCAKNPAAFWALSTVANTQKHLYDFKQGVLWETVKSGLNIGKIKDDFSVPKPDDQTMKWITFALGLAGSAATAGEAAPALQAIIAGMSAGAGAIPAAGDSKSVVDETQLEQYLSTNMDSVATYLDNAMAALAGNKAASEANKFIPPVVHSDFKDPIVRFLAQGSNLVENGQENAFSTNVNQTFTSHATRKLVDLAMHSAKYVLLADNSYGEEKCKKAYGHKWLAGVDRKMQCFYLVSHKGGSGCKDDDPSTCSFQDWHSLSEEKYKTIEGYGFNLGTYYQQLIDCSIRGDHGETGTTLDNMPLCFYNMKVASGEWVSNDRLDFQDYLVDPQESTVVCDKGNSKKNMHFSDISSDNSRDWNTQMLDVIKDACNNKLSGTASKDKPKYVCVPVGAKDSGQTLALSLLRTDAQPGNMPARDCEFHFRHLLTCAQGGDVTSTGWSYRLNPRPYGCKSGDNTV